MSNRSEHQALGAILGAQSATLAAQPKTARELAAAALVGAVTGGLSSALPDVIEPATSPNHRKTFHSVTAAGGLAYATVKGAQGISKHAPFSARLARGTAVSTAVGYLSHLALDACTPKGLPII